jgi:beta-lactamase class C
MIGGGSLRSSAADMMQFMKANLNLPVADASPQLLQDMQFAQKARFTVRPNFLMGLGWQRMTRGGKLYITKNGSNIGFSTFIGFSPDGKFGVVVLANRSASKAHQLGWQILRSLSK